MTKRRRKEKKRQHPCMTKTKHEAKQNLKKRITNIKMPTIKPTTKTRRHDANTHSNNRLQETGLPSPCHRRQAVSPSRLPPSWMSIQGCFFFVVFFLLLRAESLAVSHCLVSCFVAIFFFLSLRSKITKGRHPFVDYHANRIVR